MAPIHIICRLKVFVIFFLLSHFSFIKPETKINTINKLLRSLSLPSSHTFSWSRANVTDLIASKPHFMPGNHLLLPPFEYISKIKRSEASAHVPLGKSRWCSECKCPQEEIQNRFSVPAQGGRHFSLSLPGNPRCINSPYLSLLNPCLSPKARLSRNQSCPPLCPPSLLEFPADSPVVLNNPAPCA